MQQMKKQGLRCLLIVVFVLSAFAICSAQITSSTIAPQSQKKRVLTSEEQWILKALGSKESDAASSDAAEPPKPAPQTTDSETLKALEIANIRLKAASEMIVLLEERLKAKDAVIEAREAKVELRDEQLALAKSANQDRAQVNIGDALMLQACNQQLAKADAEIFNLRHPGLLRELFSPKEILKIGGAFMLGRATANR